jgi:hypothetical protein
MFAKTQTRPGERRSRETQMVADDEDLPARYLFYAVAVIVVIAAVAAGTFILLVR